MAKKRINQAEELFARQLDFAGYRYEREYQANPNRRWRYDFHLPDFQIIVEIEGVTFGFQGGRHQTATGYTKDCEKYNWVVCAGYSLLRFTPNMVKGTAKILASKTTDAAIETLDRFVLKDHFDSIDRLEKNYVKRFLFVNGQGEKS